MRRSRVLITGITGQDGSYLAELLASKHYDVHGIVRRVAIEDPDHRLKRILHLRDKISLHTASIEDYASIHRVVDKVEPDECYHLAAQSFVSYALDDEFSTLTTNISGTHNLLSVLKNRVPNCRFYFAGSSEMFGSPEESPQRETTRFRPRSAYGISKVAAYELTRNYRETFGFHASCGISFNHESPRRGYEYVSRKITSGIAQIVAARRDKLRLGNLAARRDWGHAREYVRAMWLMLQQDEPGDYVIATGETRSVEDFVATAFAAVHRDWREYVEVDPTLFRAAEVHELAGDPTKARTVLGWQCGVSFSELVLEMLSEDLEVQGIRPSDVFISFRDPAHAEAAKKRG